MGCVVMSVELVGLVVCTFCLGPIFTERQNVMLISIYQAQKNMLLSVIMGLALIRLKNFTAISLKYSCMHFIVYSINLVAAAAFVGV